MQVQNVDIWILVNGFKGMLQYLFKVIYTNEGPEYFSSMEQSNL